MAMTVTWVRSWAFNSQQACEDSVELKRIAVDPLKLAINIQQDLYKLQPRFITSHDRF